MAAKKLTAKQALELLKIIGVDAELAETDADSDMVAKDGVPDFKPLTNDDLINLVDTSRKEVISPRILAAKADEMYNTITAKVFGGLRKTLIAKGIPAAELEGKTEKEMAEIASAHFMSTASADVKTLQQQIADMGSAHQLALDKVTTTEKAKYSELEGKYQRKSILDTLEGSYKGAKGISPKADVKILADDFLAAQERKGLSARLSADGKEVEWYKADNTRHLNEAGTVPENTLGMIKSFHEPRGQWNEDNRTLSALEQMQQRRSDAPIKNEQGVVQSTLEQQNAMLDDI